MTTKWTESHAFTSQDFFYSETLLDTKMDLGALSSFSIYRRDIFLKNEPIRTYSTISDLVNIYLSDIHV